MATEADTCRKFVVPKLQAAGWDNDPHSIAEQRYFTHGRIVPRGQSAIRRPGKRADYLLRYTRDFILAVVEAKSSFKQAADGLQQAKEYAAILGLKFAYATNGEEIVEFDYITGKETKLTSFPTPGDLWVRFRATEKLTDNLAAERFLTPANLTTGKEPRYYQRIAIDRAVQSILQGNKRVLLTMATGTGKTDVAFQIAWKLWSSKWNAKGDPTRKPRILYLADRNFLVDDPKDKIFAPFGEARHRIEGGKVVLSRELYFSTYQSLAEDENRPGLFREFPSDFFDLIIVDECHRGSAREKSNWREILDYFRPAYQLGMTATPLREDNKDTYLYFNNPIYTYSLKQGIDDGFLAPYRVHRIVTQWDAAGWRPSQEDLDRYGRRIPDELYGTPDFERKIAMLKRTEAIAKHLTNFLRATDRYAKTIVFCVDQEHALEMKTALNNLNSDVVQHFPDYVCRVTAEEGDVGRGYMEKFQDVETISPVILTTSQLLTTGLDAPTCKNIVLARIVNSMVEFKQIIGRGTRVRDDYGKLWFNILDYTGSATIKFADPQFDGDPAFATEEEIDEYGNTRKTEVETPEEPEHGENLINDFPTGPIIIDGAPPGQRRKFYFDGGQVDIAAHLVYELDPDGKQLRVIKLTDYTAEKVRILFNDAATLRHQWEDPQERAVVIQKLAERGIDFDSLAAQAGQPEADPLDLLCHLAFNAPLRTRRERADRVKKERLEFFAKFQPDARAVLNDLLDKYTDHGATQFVLPDVLRVPPISERGNVSEIVQKFGDADQLRTAVNELQTLLYTM